MASSFTAKLMSIEKVSNHFQQTYSNRMYTPAVIKAAGVFLYYGKYENQKTDKSRI